MNLEPLVDFDSIIYRACWAYNDDLDQAIEYGKSYIFKIEEKFESKAQLFIGASTNFRTLIDPEYKANRKKIEKPKNFYEVKDFFITNYGASFTEGYEAEDVVGALATDLHVICGIDKDLKTIPGWKYNYVKETLFNVTEEEAAKNFWLQVIQGDSIDSIKGIKGMGKVKAEKLLADLDVSKYKEVVMDKYLEVYGTDGLSEFDKTARLVFIKRGSLESEYYNYY